MVDGINIISYFGHSFGLSESAKHIAKSIEKSQTPVALISADKLISHPIFEESSNLSISDRLLFSTNLFCIDQHHIDRYVEQKGWDHFKSRYNIGLLFWETNVVPSRLRRGWKYLDEIWVTSRYLQEHFSIASSLPVYHIPQSIQMPLFDQTASKKDFQLENKFTFLFCFDFGSILKRKNPAAIIKAFKVAFPTSTDVQVVIKSRSGHLFPLQLREMQELTKGDPRIIWRDESFSSRQRYDLMRVCDCYVSLHRSEGLGLTMAEALLLEKPVIATGYSGNMDFTHQNNSYLCSYKLITVDKGNSPYPKEGIWADVDIEEAAFWMRHVYENPSEAKAKAIKGKDYILKSHSYEAVGKHIKKRLNAIPTSRQPKPMPYYWLNSKSRSLYRDVKCILKKFIPKKLKKFILKTQ